MRIEFSLYELTGPSLCRTGALLRVHFQDSSCGYADCHPWPEMGDDNLYTQLQKLRIGQTTAVTDRSLHFACLDAEARGRNEHLFTGKRTPRSHRLVYDFDQSEDVLEHDGLLKIKIGKSLAFEQQKLRSFLPSAGKKTVALDANRRLNEQECRRLLESIAPWLDRIDFLEDPFPYCPDKWGALQKEFSVDFACDQDSEKYLEPYFPHRVSVIKPAVQDPAVFEKDFRTIVFTSYLDHPLGQLGAAYTAASACCQGGDEIRSGLLTHHNYYPNVFSERLREEDGRLVPSLEGTGFGYDDLLESLEWKNLA